MERMGIPAAAIAVQQLAATVGTAMAQSHGMEDYPIAMIPMGLDIAGIVDGLYAQAVDGEDAFDRLADRIADIWLRGAGAGESASTEGG